MLRRVQGRRASVKAADWQRYGRCHRRRRPLVLTGRHVFSRAAGERRALRRAPRRCAGCVDAGGVPLAQVAVARSASTTQCANQTSHRYNRRMDHHTVAAISIAGTCLDVLGSLYLAYDLLGGQHGPLRVLTRAVTYSIVFGIGYGLGLGLFFGLASGIAIGITMAIELNRAARGLHHYSLPWEGLFSAIRGAAFGAGLYRILGFRFAIAFAVLIT